MNSVGIWTDYEDYKSLALPKNSRIALLGLSRDWALASTSEKAFYVFKQPYKVVPDSFSFHESISEISCNLGMALFLSTLGDVWLWGEDLTKSGLFGQENLFKTLVPMKMPKIANEIIVSASIGSTHAGMVCTEGFLYTWGRCASGELGAKSVVVPERVESANIFKAKQVVCGENYTGICTQGGFLYIFGPEVKCECGGNTGCPYTVPALEEYYVKKAYSSPFGIVVLTDAGKCYLVKGCLCLTYLRANKVIDCLATSNEGICGMTKEKTLMFVWTKAKEKEWKVNMYKISLSNVQNLISGLGNSIALIGNELNRFPGMLMSMNDSAEPSPTHHLDRKSFEQLLGFYDFGGQTSQKNVKREEACKMIVGTLGKTIGNAFRKVKVYSYLQWVYKKAYASTFTPSIIGKVLQRINLLNKSFAFEMVFKCAKLKRVDKKPDSAAEKSAKKVLRVLEGVMKKVFFRVKECEETVEGKRRKRYLKGWKKMEKVLKTRNFRVFLKLMYGSDMEKYLKISGSSFQYKLLNSFFNPCLSKIVNYLDRSAPSINPFVFCKNIIEKHEFYKVKKYFSLWVSLKDFYNRRLQNAKLNSVLILAVKVGKLVKKKYRTLFNILAPVRRNYQLKYGLYFLLTCMCKIQSKNKSYSFNSILRQKNSPKVIETIVEILKTLAKARVSSCFHTVKMFSINQKNKSLIKFILMLQAIQEKIKYRQIIRGYNSFKRSIFNKSMTFDYGSEKSFSMRSMLNGLKFSPDSPPGLDLGEMTHRSLCETSSVTSERRASLHSFQQVLVKKITNKLSNESKSGQVASKLRIVGKKGKGAESTQEKRNAYVEMLKERQKKKMQAKPLVDNSQLFAVKKPNLTKSTRAGFDPQSWKAMKYRNGSMSLESVLSKILCSRKVFPFNKLKFFIKQGKDLQISLHKFENDLKIPQKSVESTNKSRKLMIFTKKEDLERAKVDQVCESPIESPILEVREIFSARILSPQEPDTAMIIAHLTSPPSSWKVKLYSLGLAKLSRTLRLLVTKKIFQRYLVN